MAARKERGAADEVAFALSRPQFRGRTSPPTKHGGNAPEVLLELSILSKNLTFLRRFLIMYQLVSRVHGLGR